MSTVRFILDLHLGHKNIVEFSGDHRGGRTIEEHLDLLKIQSLHQENERMRERLELLEEWHIIEYLFTGR